MKTRNARKIQSIADRQMTCPLNFHPAPTLVVVAATPAAPSHREAEPSGVKLRSVSNFVIFTAILCLLAFLAGRAPDTAGAAEPVQSAATPAKEARPMFLGLRTAVYSAKDLAQAKAWYAKVLGIQPYFDQPFYVGFNVGGYELGLIPATAAAPKRAPAGVAYWGVPDAQAAYKRLIELGATPQEEIQDVGGGILVGAVHDPFGNVLGVIENPNFKATQ